MGVFGEIVDNYYHAIQSSRNNRESRNEIHAHNLPGMVGYG